MVEGHVQHERCANSSPLSMSFCRRSSMKLTMLVSLAPFLSLGSGGIGMLSEHASASDLRRAQAVADPTNRCCGTHNVARQRTVLSENTWFTMPRDSFKSGARTWHATLFFS